MAESPESIGNDQKLTSAATQLQQTDISVADVSMDITREESKHPDTQQYHKQEPIDNSMDVGIDEEIGDLQNTNSE